MRTTVVSGVTLLGGLVLATWAGAADTHAKGIAVAREVRTEQGHRFLLTVIPPPDRGVDTRIFDVIEVTSGGDVGTPFGKEATGKVEVATTESDEDLVDVSDLHLRLEILSAAASCDIRGTIKYKKVNLSGKKKTSADFPGASAAIVAVYPTKGDVDARVLGPDGTTCHASSRNTGEFDLAACNNCAGVGAFVTGVIENPFSGAATYVGGFAGVFVN